MKNVINKINIMVKEGYFQRAIKEILMLVESDNYRNNETVKEIYYSNFSDGETIKEMMEYDNLKLINSSDNIVSIESLDDNTYYTWFADDKEMIVNYLNETVILKALRDLEKLL